MRTIILLILSALILTACSAPHSDARLDKIAASIDSIPETALKALAAIDRDSLPDADRHYLDLLTIKAADKAYVDHKSDSLILDVINYYSSHEKDLYPEALYYAGRVYSDLGDFPTALKHFHDALDRLHDTDENNDIRENVLSQYARALNKVRLYDDAINTLLSLIKIEEERKDTLNLIYDLELLGDTYIRNKQFHLAENTFKKALNLSNGFSTHHQAKSKMYLADIKLELGKIDSALTLIKDVPNNVNKKFHNTALCHAARIYYKTGMLDTAYLYSKTIIHNGDSIDKLVGYQITLSPDLINYIPKDSLGIYIWDYRTLIEKILDYNQSQLALNQENIYNYRFHEKEKLDVIHTNEKLKIGIISTFLLITLMSTILLYFKNKHKNYIIALHEAHIIIKKYKDIYGVNSTVDNSQNSHEYIIDTPVHNKDRATDLREDLQKDLISISENSIKDKIISSEILQSETYKKLQDLIASQTILNDDDDFWKEIEETILNTSPNFSAHIRLLAQGKLSTSEYHTIMLIKCGCKPSQLAVLFGRSKTTIGSRRDAISIKILDKKVEPKIIDALIRIL